MVASTLRIRFSRAVELLGRALERMENVLVLVVGLGREVVPHEALHRMARGLHLRLLVGLGDQRGEDLEAEGIEILLGPGIAALDGKAQQALGAGLVG